MTNPLNKYIDVITVVVPSLNAPQEPRKPRLLSRLVDWWNSRRLDPMADFWTNEPSFGEWKSGR